MIRDNNFFLRIIQEFIFENGHNENPKFEEPTNESCLPASVKTSNKYKHFISLSPKEQYLSIAALSSSEKQVLEVYTRNIFNFVAP